MGLPGKKIYCCTETGLTCECIASGGICGIFWYCAGDTNNTIAPQRIKITRLPSTVVVDTNELTGFYSLPEGTNDTFRVQMCCDDTSSGTCTWRTLWTGTLDNTADEQCLLTVAGGTYEINASTIIGVPEFDCDAFLRVVVAASRQDTVSPLIAEMYINSTRVFSGADPNPGCIPDGATDECQSGPAADLSCSPPQSDFTDTYYIDLDYPIPMAQGSVLVRAVNQVGDIQACTIDIPCYWHYNVIRVEIPTCTGQTLSCNGGDPRPFGFSTSLGNRWRQTWSTEMTMTASLGGSYLFYSCSIPYPLVIGTGAFSYTYTETGKIAYHTSAAPTTRLEADYTRTYIYTGTVQYILDPTDIAWGPGYTQFGSLSTDPDYFPAILRVRVVFLDNEVDYDVNLSHEHDGSWADPYSIITTGTQTYAFFEHSLMAVVSRERDIDCASNPDVSSDIEWEWKAPFDYTIVYDPPSTGPSNTGDFPLPPIGGINGGAIGVAGDACSCINEGSQTVNNETLLFEHTVI